MLTSEDSYIKCILFDVVTINYLPSTQRLWFSCFLACLPSALSLFSSSPFSFVGLHSVMRARLKGGGPALLSESAVSWLECVCASVCNLRVLISHLSWMILHHDTLSTSSSRQCVCWQSLSLHPASLTPLFAFQILHLFTYTLHFMLTDSNRFLSLTALVFCYLFSVLRSDCVDILTQCGDRKRFHEGQTPERICELLSPIDDPERCIPLHRYLSEWTYSS